MKIGISVPDEVHRAVDKAARRRRVPRSSIYVRAAIAYLENESREGITERLNAVYAGEENEDAFVSAAARRAMRRK